MKKEDVQIVTITPLPPPMEVIVLDGDDEAEEEATGGNHNNGVVKVQSATMTAQSNQDRNGIAATGIVAVQATPTTIQEQRLGLQGEKRNAKEAQGSSDTPSLGASSEKNRWHSSILSKASVILPPQPSDRRLLEFEGVPSALLRLSIVWNCMECCVEYCGMFTTNPISFLINDMIQKKTPFSFLSRALPLMRCVNRSYKHHFPLHDGYHVNGPRRVLAGGWSSGTVRLLSSSREMSEMDMETNPFSSSSGDGLLKKEQNDGGARAGVRMWTAEEDMLLRKGVEELGEKWTEISRRYLPHRSDNDVRNRWNRVLRPDITSGPWSAEEDAKLLELVKQYGESSWPKVAPHMDGRPAHSCLLRWRMYLDPSVDRSEWTAEEDEIIKKVIMEDMDQKHVRSEWQSLLALLPTKRTREALRHHYQSLKNQLFPVKKAQWTKEDDAKLLEACRIGKAVAESLWTEEEDAELLQAVRQFGDSGKWSAVASCLSSSHTARDCKVRWERELSRLLNISPWTKEEDDLLISLRSKGLYYDDLFHHLKTRTYAAIAKRCEELGVGAKPNKRWTKEETALLVKLVKESKEGGGRVNWKWIAKQMSSERTANACLMYYKKYYVDKESKEEKAEEEQEIEKSEKR
eukprot:scaffold805_cov308-Ochromonas_danica.AAC.1